MRRGTTPLLSLVAMPLLLLGACAWTNPDNRPVWNAFEAHLVPEEPTWFAVSLPLTVPLGLVAIAADTLIVHPACVVDDAADDAADLWRELDWDEGYYTELGFLPVRAVGTPVVFAGSFLGRSLFDIGPRSEPDPAEVAARRAKQIATLAAWIDGIGAGEERGLGGDRPAEWDASLDPGVAQALATATPLGRLRLFELLLRYPDRATGPAPALGLRDPDAVVRYLLLGKWPQALVVDDATRAALRADPVESVRRRVRARWPQ